jgi:putative ABC transport system permease protein
MNNFFYARLAANNIQKNRRIYIPYIITATITIAFYYIMKSLSLNQGLSNLIGAATISYTLGLGCRVIMIFAVIFLFYTNSFLMKRREKEFGLFHILGMEKKHLMRVAGIETFYIALLALAMGFLFGIALDKVMYLVILRILRADVSLGFYISKEAIVSTICLFAGIFFLIYLNTVRRLRSFKPIELLRSSNVGEKEPRANWLLALLGLLSLGGGYYLSVSVKNPITALTIFFAAVILVIIGTYLLFTSGSIVFLKMLRANKRYYYQTRHFIGISGMLYRMKQNAAGLANICILSTMVLVMVSSTASLMIGLEDLVKIRYPYDFTVYRYQEDKVGENDNQELQTVVSKALADYNLTETTQVGYESLIFATVELGNEFTIQEHADLSLIDSTTNLAFITLEDYNRITGENISLQDNEVLVYSNRGKIESDEFSVDQFQFKIVKRLDDFIGNGILASDIASTHFIVVNSPDIIKELYLWQREIYGENASDIRYCYGVDAEGSDENKVLAYEAIRAALKSMKTEDFVAGVECRAEAKTSIYGLYGGLFFIGAFLGLLFTIAAILMIYYKQITEGYYDRDRYVIMQNVGMSQKDVKDSIRSQILTVFFLPLVTAGIHIIFAYPAIEKILALLNLVNTKLYIYCTIGCFAVFSVFYIIVYAWTAKLYYGIVKK